MHVAALGEPFDRKAIRYALSWRHPPGALADLPNLEAIFSLGAGVDHLFADPALPDGRSCASSIPICATG